ncbi:hypothetical protein BJ508DRAFT_329412 [Ascobolus immersus RN42]|uniref:Uncharacterized protein n=1 Tax=Ascobolus immersus RN42 TaxID=1160509 RepID=A0A3N4HYP3_ASCIM|nr:hypothetical protein BJ508DRAFT_329412 [Ascobolus immersus RN42]
MPQNPTGTKRKRNVKGEKRHAGKHQNAEAMKQKKKQKTSAASTDIPTKSENAQGVDSDSPTMDKNCTSPSKQEKVSVLPSKFAKLPNELIFDILSHVIDFRNLFPEEGKAFANILNIQLVSRGVRSLYLAYEAHMCRALLSESRYPSIALALLDVIRNPVKTEQECVLREMIECQSWGFDLHIPPAIKHGRAGIFRSFDLWFLQKFERRFVRPWVDNARLNFKVLEKLSEHSAVYKSLASSEKTELSTAELERFELGIWNMYRCFCYVYTVEHNCIDDSLVLDKNGEAKITNLCRCSDNCRDSTRVLNMQAIVQEWPIEEQLEMFSAWCASANIMSWGHWPCDGSKFNMRQPDYGYFVPQISPKGFKDPFLYNIFRAPEFIYDQMLDMDKLEKHLGKERRDTVKKFLAKLAEEAIWDDAQEQMDELMALRAEFGWPKGYDRRCYRTTHALVTKNGKKKPKKKTLLIGNSTHWGGKHTTWTVRDSLTYKL